MSSKKHAGFIDTDLEIPEKFLLDLYQIIKNKVDAGISALEEFYQAELNLATSESNMQNQQVVLDNTLDAFKKLIGISLFEEIDAAADISHHPVEVNLQKAMNHALTHRQELRQRNVID